MISNERRGGYRCSRRSRSGGAGGDERTLNGDGPRFVAPCSSGSDQREPDPHPGCGGGAGGSSDTGTPGAGGAASRSHGVDSANHTGSVIAIGGAGGGAGVGSGDRRRCANVSVYVAPNWRRGQGYSAAGGGNGGSGLRANGGAGGRLRIWRPVPGARSSPPRRLAVRRGRPGGKRRSAAMASTALGYAGVAGTPRRRSSMWIRTASSLSEWPAGGASTGAVSGQGLDIRTAVASVSPTSTVAGAPVTAGAIQSGGCTAAYASDGGGGRLPRLRRPVRQQRIRRSAARPLGRARPAAALGGAAGRSDTGTAGVAGNAVSIPAVQDNTARQD